AACASNPVPSAFDLRFVSLLCSRLFLLFINCITRLKTALVMQFISFVGSVGSMGSMGSMGAVGSMGSMGSVGSVGSVNAVEESPSVVS
nr:hypothetical protein [Alistipes sp.]